MTSTGSRTASARTKPVDTPASTPRAAIYLRVSTGRQAEQELSIPDQRAQTQAWAAQRGWRVVAEYIDGTSATDDKRPEFQRMIERACDGENAFDVIVGALVLALLPRCLWARILRAQACQALRAVGVNHAGAGRRAAQVIRLFLSSVNRSSWYPWSTLPRSELCKKRSR